MKGEQTPAVWWGLHPVIEHHRYLVAGPGHLQLTAGFTTGTLQLIAELWRLDARRVEQALEGREQVQAIFGMGVGKAQALGPCRGWQGCSYRPSDRRISCGGRALGQHVTAKFCASAPQGGEQHVGEELEEVGLAQPLAPALLLI